MNEPGGKEKDPVCGMLVDPLRNQVLFRGVGYAFCSQQCRERFTAGPGLYVGWRRSLAPKQKGMELVKRRRMALGLPLTEAQFGSLRIALLAMMGVTAVRYVESAADRARDFRVPETPARTAALIETVEITYDLLQATAAQLERRMAELNAPPSDGWGRRLERDFIHYLEKCELDDLEAGDAGPARGGSGWRGSRKPDLDPHRPVSGRGRDRALVRLDD